jgi:hypothetical protein
MPTITDTTNFKHRHRLSMVVQMRFIVSSISAAWLFAVFLYAKVPRFSCENKRSKRCATSVNIFRGSHAVAFGRTYGHTTGDSINHRKINKIIGNGWRDCD